MQRDLKELSDVIISGGTFYDYTFEQWSLSREPEILVVSHAGFLTSLLGRGKGKSRRSLDSFVLTQIYQS